MLDYAARAATVWFVGFFPLFEIYVAVPLAVGMGLDFVSAVFWSVTGNFTPVLLVHFGYDALMRIPRVNAWLGRLTSERLQRWLNRYGTWALLVVTPWTGVWVMTATVRVLGMSPARVLTFSFVSIAVYAIGIAALLYAGVDLFSQSS